MHRLYPTWVGGTGAVGLLLVRLVVGAAFVLHGWPKIQHPFDWMGPSAPVPGVLQAAAAVAEFGGGIAWMLGLLTPLFSLLLVGTMAFAAFGVHIASGHPFVAANWPGQPYQPSFEPALAYLAVALLLLLAGPGTLSLDAGLFRRAPEEASSWQTQRALS
jgi:putative oxidoreductase